MFYPTLVIFLRYPVMDEESDRIFKNSIGGHEAQHDLDA